MLHDWLYAMDAYDNSSHNVGPREIERRLRHIVFDAKERLLAKESATPIGILSSDDRDTWAEVSLICAFLSL